MSDAVEHATSAIQCVSATVLVMALHISQHAGKHESSESLASKAKLVLAHGFTQNGNCWGALQGLLSVNYSLCVVDLPGHGRSEHDAASLERSSELLTAAGGKAAYVGYSMGGRIALHSALHQPDRVDHLVLLGVNPGLDDDDERAKRREHDKLLAAQLTEDGVERFLTRWLAQPLFSGLSDAQSCREQRLENRCRGLVASLLNRSLGCQASLWGRLAELSMPVLLIAGESDVKYRAINERMAKLIPRVETVTIPGGHAAHLEEPGATAAIIEQYVANI